MQHLIKRLLLALALSTALVSSAAAQGCLGASASGGSQQGGLTLTTGNLALDNLLAREHVWAMQKFGVRASMFILNDGANPNAFANPQSLRPEYPQGTVLFGRSMMAQEFASSYGNGTSIPAILSHEFGHIYQFSRGSMTPGPATELQADYLAGWYMGDRQTSIPADLGYMTNSFFKIGDYQFNSELHHGTPRQRAAAFREGFRNKGLSLNGAWTASGKFVGQLLAQRDDGPGPGFGGGGAGGARAGGSGGGGEDSLSKFIRSAASDIKNRFKATIPLAPSEWDCIRETYDDAYWLACDLVVDKSQWEEFGRNLRKSVDAALGKLDWEISRDPLLMSATLPDQPDPARQWDVVIAERKSKRLQFMIVSSKKK